MKKGYDDDNDNDAGHPSGLNYSPRRKVFRRGQKERQTFNLKYLQFFSKDLMDLEFSSKDLKDLEFCPKDLKDIN